MLGTDDGGNERLLRGEHDASCDELLMQLGCGEIEVATARRDGAVTHVIYLDCVRAVSPLKILASLTTCCPAASLQSGLHNTDFNYCTVNQAKSLK